MIRWCIKTILAILSWIYPKIDELLLEKFILIVFPGHQFSSLIQGNVFDRQLVFKVLKDRFRELKNFYIIAVYYAEDNKVVIKAIRKEEVTSNDITRNVFNNLYKSL